MNAPLKFFLIRHGETAWALTGQHTGVTDLALTPHGEDESRALARRLASIVFSGVLVSPRLRARQTCEFAGLGSAAEIRPELAEWDYGDYEGRRSVDIRIDRPDWNIWRDGCPKGEMPADVAARADALIAKLMNMQGNVALFSHGQFGPALAARWIGLPVSAGAHFALHTASVSILGTDPRHGDRRVISLWNETPGARSG